MNFFLRLFLPAVAFAQNTVETPDWHLDASAVNPGTLGTLIVQTSAFAIRVAGVLAIILLIYSGIKRITSSGSSEAIGEADEIMWAALIGLMIALVSILGLKLINPGGPGYSGLTTFQPLTLTPITNPGDQKVALNIDAIETDPGGPYKPPAAGSVPNGQRVAGMTGITADHANDRTGIPLGTIRRDDGTDVPIDPHLNATLRALQAAEIPVNIQSLVGDHDQFVHGRDGVQSRHWDGAAMDITNGDGRAIQYIHDHAAELGVQQLISQRWPQLNLNNGQPFVYSQTFLDQEPRWFHVGF